MKILLSASLIFLSCRNAVALYTVNIVLKQFTNPGQRLLNGAPCDYATRYPECEHKFQICLDFPNGDKDDHNQFRIRGPFDLGLNNEWETIKVDQLWQGNILMKVLVTDEDPGKSDDLVDKLSGIFKLETYRSIDDIDFNVFMNGNHARLALHIAVFCNRNWKGPKCDCDVTNQNYYCDHDGNKTCNTHWYGLQCDVECLPADGLREHYECSLSGNKVCHKDYYGEDCDKYCKSTDDHKGHYTCDQNGNKMCNKNWCSENCNVFCGEVHTAAPEIYPRIISSTNEGTIDEIDSGTSEGKKVSRTQAGPVIGSKTWIIILGSLLAVACAVIASFLLKKKICASRETVTKQEPVNQEGQERDYHHYYEIGLAQSGHENVMPVDQLQSSHTYEDVSGGKKSEESGYLEPLKTGASARPHVEDSANEKSEEYDYVQPTKAVASARPRMMFTANEKSEEYDYVAPSTAPPHAYVQLSATDETPYSYAEVSAKDEIPHAYVEVLGKPTSETTHVYEGLLVKDKSRVAHAYMEMRPRAHIVPEIPAVDKDGNSHVA